MNLSEYIKRRNGVPMGANNSLRNMLARSFGAGKFSIFWRYWNPIWSYYLAKYIFKPMKTIFPPAFALVLTFAFCGFLHDLVIMILRRDFALLFTPWFLIMALWLIISDILKIDYSKYAWISRAFINTAIIGTCFMLAYKLKV
jgi:hypothetical protein